MPDRENLVLLPGLVCDRAVWRYQEGHLAELGHITVPPAARAETMAGLAADVLADAPDRFALAGFSMGGYVALEIMRQAPERVTRLALLDTTARPDTPEKATNRPRAIAACEAGKYEQVIEAMLPVLLHPDRQSAPLADFVRAMAARVGAKTFARRHKAMMTRTDARGLLRETDIPVRAICGRQDAMTSLEEHQEIADLAPRGRFSLIEECGHMSILEQPHAASALLRDWLIYG